MYLNYLTVCQRLAQHCKSSRLQSFKKWNNKKQSGLLGFESWFHKLSFLLCKMGKRRNYLIGLL